MPEYWQSIVYQYVIGGAFFFAILFWALKTKALKMSSKSDRNTVFILILGFVFFFALHSVWTYWITK